MKEPYNFTISFFSDSFNTSRSSKHSLYSIMCSVNELPYYCKRSHIFLHTLWPSPKPRRSDTLLTPFVRETIELEQSGIKWIDSTGVERASKVKTLTLTADGTSRPFLMCATQFNGLCGCGHCEHEGVVVRKGRGHVRVYPIRLPLPPDRTHEKTLEYATAAASDQNPTGKPVKGIKGPSWLFLIPDFENPDGVIPDSMHAVFIGMVTQFIVLWLQSPVGCPYHIDVDRFNEVLASIKVPAEIEKLPRIFDGSWKAQEKRNFLFFYSVPALRQLLERKYYRHWLLLVNAIRLVSRKEFSEESIDIAYLLATDFILTTEKIYGIEHNSYNMHIFLHAIEFARKWGGLWATSAFMYESEIASIKRYYHGSKAPEKQIFGYALMRNKLRDFSSTHIPFASEQVQDFYRKLDGSVLPRHDLPNSSEALGAGVVAKLNQEEIRAVEDLIQHTITCYNVKTYSRTFYNGKIFSTTGYARNQRRDNSIVVLSDGRTVRITKIFELRSNCNCEEKDGRCLVQSGSCVGRKRVVLCGDILEFQPLPRMPHAHTDNYDLVSLLSWMPGNPREPFQSIYFDPSDVQEKCVCVSIGQFMYRVVIDVRMEHD